MEKKVTPFAGQSSFAKEISSLVQTLSGNNASVLLIGERGTGKRLIAQHIHKVAFTAFRHADLCKAFATMKRIF